MCGRVGEYLPFWKILITQLSRLQEVFLVIDLWTRALRVYERKKRIAVVILPHSHPAGVLSICIEEECSVLLSGE